MLVRVAKLVPSAGSTWISSDHLKPFCLVVMVPSIRIAFAPIFHPFTSSQTD
jgi:hypothetical protein